MSTIGAIHLIWYWFILRMLTEPLGESGGPLVGKGDESDVKRRDLQGCSPNLF
jgi:hypothetical protein